MVVAPTIQKNKYYEKICMIFGKTENIIKHGNLHFLQPVPLWKRIITEEEIGMPLQEFNDRLKQIAKEYYEKWMVEVPDEKHLEKSQLGERRIESLNNRELFSHRNDPAIGKWHAVKTNDFLDLDTKETKLLKSILMKDYTTALSQYSELTFDAPKSTKSISYSNMDESWMQFYKNGDYKVLHNHLRYDDAPSYKNIWAGGYYIDDGEPDKWQPYSGRFEFNIRDNKYFVKPEPGLIMLWPGDILHAVHPFYGKRERVCVNFNLSTR